MNYELKSARYLAREVILQAGEPGDAVVDATMGNGHDTQMLCETVGPEGRVYAFDVQAQAVEETRKRLWEQGLDGRAELILAGHAVEPQKKPVQPVHKKQSAPARPAAHGSTPNGNHRRDHRRSSSHGRPVMRTKR